MLEHFFTVYFKINSCVTATNKCKNIYMQNFTKKPPSINIKSIKKLFPKNIHK